MYLAPELLVGRTLQHTYHIESLIGEGGMAYVYKARHRTLKGPVALKILKHRHTQRSNFRERFLREATLQYQLHHPHIVRVLDFIEDQDLIGCVQEWCNGGALEPDSIREKASPSLPLHQLQTHFLPLLDAMHEVHQQGYIHRDIKPTNILVQQKKEQTSWKISDFGLLKDLSAEEITQSGAIIGTFHYISPEQLEESRDVDCRSDIYSLGAVLYQLLVGQVPFPVRMPRLAVQIMEAPPLIPADLPAPLVHILQKVLAKQPAVRYESCQAFKRALSSALEEVKETYNDAHTTPGNPAHESPTQTEQAHEPDIQAPASSIPPGQAADPTDELAFQVSSQPPLLPQIFAPSAREHATASSPSPKAQAPSTSPIMNTKTPWQVWLLALAFTCSGGLLIGRSLGLFGTNPRPMEARLYVPSLQTKAQKLQRGLASMSYKIHQYAIMGNWGKTRFILKIQCRHHKRNCYWYAYWLHHTLAILKASCATGDPVACHWTKVAQRKRYSSSRYLRRALPIYRVACTEGDARGCLALGIYAQATPERPVKQERAHWLRRACQLKNGRGCWHLGRLLQTQSSRRQQALRAFRRACAQYEAKGCLAWGRLLATRQQSQQALTAFRKACTMGSQTGCRMSRNAKQHQRKK